MNMRIPRIVIAATQSGAGKTTIVSGVLAGLKAMGKRVQSYKVGPDYIDPGYHELASGRPGHNLDTWLAPPDKISAIFARTAQNADIAVIEGVMGLYDGGQNGVSSTAEIAKLLNAPVLLVIDAKSMGDSAAAIALGFRAYDPAVNLCGVLLNRIGSSTHEHMIREAMKKINMPVWGCIRRSAALALPERHLGLTPTTETDAAQVMDAIGEAIAAQADLDGIIRLAENAPAMKVALDAPETPKAPLCRIAVAQDEAFSFYYPESMAALAALGAEIVSFSPLRDAALPPDIDGVIVGGGFPEMFSETLSGNCAMRRCIAAAHQAGLPIYGECGGLMYLTEKIVDFSGKDWPMAGLIPAVCSMNEKLQTVGYVEAVALSENLLCRKGDCLRGHEFHFSTMQAEETRRAAFPWAFDFKKKRTGAVYASGFAAEHLLASYLHLHFAGNPRAAERLVSCCAAYRKARKGNALTS